MIIEDVGEQTKSRHYVGKVLKKKSIPFKREEIRIAGERVGDYIERSSDKICWMVERKRDTDFYNSCVDGSVFKQMEKMTNLYHGTKYLIFEGNWDKLIKDNWALRGLLWSTRLKSAWYGINFVVCEDEKETALFLFLLNKYGRKIDKKGLKTSPHLPKLVKSYDQRLLPLMAVKGIGQKMAKKLLDRFHSIDYIVELAKNNKNKLMAVKGIGKKTVQRIHDMFVRKEKLNYGRGKGHRKGIRSHGNKTAKVHGRSNPKMVNNADLHRRGQNYRNTPYH
jgi:ERCC4-type nuclease